MLRAIEQFTPQLRPHVSAPPPQSPEYRRFLQARDAYVECVWAGDDTRAAIASDLVDDAIEALIERPVTTLRDVVELAQMVTAERWDTDEHGLPDQPFCADHPLNIDRALIRAIHTLGGHHG